MGVGGSLSIPYFLNSQKATEQPVSEEPVARIKIYAISEKGIVLSSNASPHLPEIDVSIDTPTVGSRLGGVELAMTLSFLNELKFRNIGVGSVKIYSKDMMILTTADTIRVLYASTNDVVALSSSLQTMLSVFTIEGTRPREIDLRYDKPVLRYN